MSESIDPYELRAHIHRVMAARIRVFAAIHELAANCALAERSVRHFADAWNAGVAREVADHPDLAELNVQMDGFYGTGPADGEETPSCPA